MGIPLLLLPSRHCCSPQKTTSPHTSSRVVQDPGWKFRQPAVFLSRKSAEFDPTFAEIHGADTWRDFGNIRRLASRQKPEWSLPVHTSQPCNTKCDPQ